MDLDTTHAPRVAQADAEKQRRERERREFKEAQELESLRRAFKRMDKKGDGKIDVNELMEELEFLGYKVKPQEAALIIWEVDDDADDCVDWEVRAHLACLHNGCLSTALPADSQEFRTMFYRIRDDTTGAEPRKLFNGAPARAGWAHARLCDSPGGVRVAAGGTRRSRRGPPARLRLRLPAARRLEHSDGRDTHRIPRHGRPWPRLSSCTSHWLLHDCHAGLSLQ